MSDLLGASVFKVRSLERQGVLHPVMRNGTNFFTRAEVDALLAAQSSPPSSAERVTDRRTDGEVAAAVFKLFDEDKTLREIVQATAVTPARVRDLFDEYMMSLEDGFNVRRQQERNAARERQAQKNAKDDEEHRRRMAQIDREIQAQAKEAKRFAKISERAQRRQASLKMPEPIPSGSSRASASAWTEVEPDPDPQKPG